MLFSKAVALMHGNDHNRSLMAGAFSFTLRFHEKETHIFNRESSISDIAGTIDSNSLIGRHRQSMNFNFCVSLTNVLLHLKGFHMNCVCNVFFTNDWCTLYYFINK